MRAEVRAYIDDIVSTCGVPNGPVVSIVVFGSAATGGHAMAVSDVDLIAVVADSTSLDARRGVSRQIDALETRHGLGKHRPKTSGLGGMLAGFADRMSGNDRACFVCTRADLLSGDPARILDIPRAQALFVDRITMSGILGFAVTAWGERLLPSVPLQPVRRLDVAMAFHRLFNVLLFTAVTYPLLPGATGYAMDILKHSVHSCYFCYHGRVAPLTDEVHFLEQRGGGPVLRQLLALRSDKRTSYSFVLRCMPSLVRMHWRTLRSARFPVATPVADHAHSFT